MKYQPASRQVARVGQARLMLSIFIPLAVQSRPLWEDKLSYSGCLVWSLGLRALR